MDKVKKYLKNQVHWKIDEHEKEEIFKDLLNFSSNQNPHVRKMVLLYIAHNMNERDCVQLRNLFIKIDDNKNGLING